MEQQTCSKIGKEYIKAVYCHPAYLTSMQSTSCEMPGWIKHKLESRLQGEISITYWARKNWRFWTVVLEKTLESPLDCKIKPVSPKGNKSGILIARTDAEAEAPILWPCDMKNWLTVKDPDAGKGWRQEQKGTRANEMVGWHYWL